MSVQLVTDYDDLIRQASLVYGHRFDLLQAQVIVESSGDPWAFRFEKDFFETYIKGKTVPGSPFGPLAACSYGLLQILLETALELGFSDRPEQLFVPRVGLAWGAKYLQRCRDREGGDSFKALMRYNGRGISARRYAEAVYIHAGRKDEIPT